MCNPISSIRHFQLRFDSDSPPDPLTVKSGGEIVCDEINTASSRQRWHVDMSYLTLAPVGPSPPCIGVKDASSNLKTVSFEWKPVRLE